jgi:hypothetical protein
MMLVRLTGDWTDSGGLSHHAGETIEVDAVTLVQLEAAGVVDTSTGPGSDPTQWPGLT